MNAVGRFLVICVALSLVGGCSAAPLRGQAELLTFIVNGGTTRSEAIERLGEPNRRLLDGQICAWRIGHDEAGPFVATGSTDTDWLDVDASLVLVFDSAGLLARHALVPIHAP